jgi:hypothetical protein
MDAAPADSGDPGNRTVNCTGPAGGSGDTHQRLSDLRAGVPLKADTPPEYISTGIPGVTTAVMSAAESRTWPSENPTHTLIAVCVSSGVLTRKPVTRLTWPA